ncbi:putative reverse transcriptase domain-containing protein [Tanacetum coccineum]|uniref:Reverse transcriptase domain-containing protein n=1 Tax=Tanacetum coccineum TaxID=301880 RepID=A0ABQ4ZD37_9ASTR
MAPKAMNQAAIERLITERVNAAVEAERERQVNARGQGNNEAGGQGGAPAARECTFSGFMKCNPTVFHGHEGAVELSRWFEKTEMVFGISECAEARKVKFAAATLQGRALTWWNSQVATMGLEAANQIGWTEMRRLMTEEFCPIEEIQRMEHELWNLKVKEFDITAYTKRFHELVQLCPEMVPSERKKIEAYIRGLTDNIKGTVIGSKPTSLNEAVRMAHALMEQKAQARIERIAEGNKRKWESSQGGNNGGYAGNKPLCNRCGKHHFGYCKVVCSNCGKPGHMARDCKGKAIATGANARPTVTCYDCGEKGHTRNYCPKKRDPQGEEARGRAYVIRDAEKQQGPNVVTGTFLLNNRYATVLFDSGSDKSFVNTSFSHLIDINPVRLDTSYEVELADGRVASTNTILRGCTLNLLDHLFKIDLMPIELGTFDVVIGMDWLVDQDAVIVCGKKVVHIPVKNKTLVVEGDRSTSRLKIISCIKASKYIERGHQLFVAHVTEKEPKEKRLEDVPVIRDFPEVFPDDLPGLPTISRQAEFKLYCIGDATMYGYFEFHRMLCGLLPMSCEVKRAQNPPSEDHLELLKMSNYTPIRSHDFWLESCNFSALPEGTKTSSVYCDAHFKGYGAVLMVERERKRSTRESARWIELLSRTDDAKSRLPSWYGQRKAVHQKPFWSTLKQLNSQSGSGENYHGFVSGFKKLQVVMTPFRGLMVKAEKQYRTLERDMWRAIIIDLDRLFAGVYGLEIAPTRPQSRNGIGPVAYKLELPDKLRGIHNTFHVSNLKKCLADENLVIPLEEIQLDDKLHFIEEPVEIMDREVKQLKQSRIPIVKVRWNSRRGPEYTWEREDFFKRNYPHLFSSNKKTRLRNRAPGRRSLKEGRM